MRWKLPTPLHGWRMFIGEVGVIVLGVLIALAAQQTVDGIKADHQVQIFREAVRDELALDLGTYEFRQKEDACIGRRINELQRWLDDWRAGKGQPLKGPIGIPRSISLATNIWQSRDTAIMSNMPAEERMGLSWLYDRFANAETQRLDEREGWVELGQFNGATTLTHDDQIRLQGLIVRVQHRRIHFMYSASLILKRAAEMEMPPPLDAKPPTLELGLCAPILPPIPEAPAPN